jgi:uncharacterized protein (TIGR02453 family)
MAGFAGFSPQALKFLKALKKNNEREWFQPRKDEYERECRLPMIQLVTALHGAMAGFAPEYVQDPAKAVMRIYRDTRFSKNKTPYKTYVAAALRRRGLSKDGSGCFYFHFDEKELLIAAGVYAPMPDELRAIREHLSGRHAEFKKLANAPKLKTLLGELQGQSLTRVPKGFDCEHPAVDLLRRKQFFFHITLEPQVLTSAALYPELLKRIKAVTPVLDFLNQPLLGLAKGNNNARFLSDDGF